MNTMKWVLFDKGVKWSASTHDVHAATRAAHAADQHIEGVRHKGMVPNWSSRTALRLSQMVQQDPAARGLPGDMRNFGQNRKSRVPVTIERLG
jgi:hypothetical protein